MAALIAKDFSELFKNRLSLVVTVLVVVMIPTYYALMPSEVEETLVLGVRAPGLEEAFAQLGASSTALQIRSYNGTSALREAVQDGGVAAGIELAPDFVQRLLAGAKPEVNMIFSSVVPREARDSISTLMEELSFILAGQKLPVDFETEIIGEDLAGKQVAFRDQAKPMWLTLVLMVELISLSYLIIEEKQTGAIHAILVTPATSTQVFAAKTIVGATLASVEGTLVLVLMGQLGTNAPALLLTVLTGAVLATGFAFLVSAPAKDIMSSFSWLILVYIAMLIPPVTVIYPAVSSPVIKILPSYYLADNFNKVLNQGLGLREIGGNLLILVVLDVVVLLAGVIVLRRKYR